MLSILFGGLLAQRDSKHVYELRNRTKTSAGGTSTSPFLAHRQTDIC